MGFGLLGLGLVLVIIGAVAGIGILYTIGGILLLIWLVLLVLDLVSGVGPGVGIGGRRPPRRGVVPARRRLSHVGRNRTDLN